MKEDTKDRYSQEVQPWMQAVSEILEKMTQECTDMAGEIMKIPDQIVYQMALIDPEEGEETSPAPFRFGKLEGKEDGYRVIFDETFLKDVAESKDEDLLAFWVFWMLRVLYQDMATEAYFSRNEKIGPEEDYQEWEDVYLTTCMDEKGKEQPLEIPGERLDADAFALLLAKFRNPNLDLNTFPFPVMDRETAGRKAHEYLNRRSEIRRYLFSHSEKQKELGIRLG